MGGSAVGVAVGNKRRQGKQQSLVYFQTLERAATEYIDKLEVAIKLFQWVTLNLGILCWEFVMSVLSAPFYGSGVHSS